MALEKTRKAKLIKEFQVNNKDTGSAEVQVAILTEEINLLTKHMQSHIHDYSSQRGLQKKISERKKLLDYLAKNDINKYREVIKKLNLRK